jgi:hypothetical protein
MKNISMGFMLNYTKGILRGETYRFLIVRLQPHKTTCFASLELEHSTANNVLRVGVDTIKDLPSKSFHGPPGEAFRGGLVLSCYAEGLLALQGVTANLSPALEEVFGRQPRWFHVAVHQDR